MRRNIVDNGCPIGIAVLLAVLSLWSCSGSDHSAERVVKEWLGREIVFPDSMVFTVQGDTVDYNWQDAEYKIVTFVDSAGCTECRLKLPMWHETFETLQADADIALLMIIADKDTDDIYGILSRQEFPLPVCVDTKNMMDSLNKFPYADDFRTFLVDSENRIIAIGNPVTNKGILKFYRQQMGCTDSNDVLPIIVDRHSSNVGVVRDPVITQFEITNTSDSTLVISKVLSSCDCTKAEMSNDVISPGTLERLNVIQSPDSVSGEFEREINVYFEGYPDFVTFSIRGFMP